MRTASRAGARGSPARWALVGANVNGEQTVSRASSRGAAASSLVASRRDLTPATRPALGWSGLGSAKSALTGHSRSARRTKRPSAARSGGKRSRSRVRVGASVGVPSQGSCEATFATAPPPRSGETIVWSRPGRTARGNPRRVPASNVVQPWTGVWEPNPDPPGAGWRRGSTVCSPRQQPRPGQPQSPGRLSCGPRHYALTMGLAEELQDETAEVLATLIRFKTVNPPGGERACQEWLAGYLEDAGLTVELAGAEPERPNLVARLERGEGETLGYLSHVDTVLADAEDWSADPWGGEIRDGVLYGRGAIDMKNQTAAEVVAAKHLAAQRQLPRHAEDHQRRRRGDRRRARGEVDHRGAPGPLARRLPAQRGRGRGDAVRRPPPLRRLRGREGHVPLQRPHVRPRRPRLRPRPGVQRAAQARAADHPAGRGPAGL